MDVEGIRNREHGIEGAGPNVRVHIERVILEGIDLASDRHSQLQAAIEAELTRLLAMDSTVSQWQVGRAVNSLPGDTLQLTVENHPGLLGRQIAQAVYGGIAR